MPYKPVDTAIKVILGPCIDDTDFKSREEALTYDQAGMEIDAILEKHDGTIVTTAITPTTGGDYDWAHTDQGYYELELPASGGASFNNTEEGILTVVGFCTGVLPFRSVSYDMIPTQVYNSMVKGTDKLQVHADEITNNLITASAIQDGAITAAKFGSNAINAAALATDAVNEIADGVWEEPIADHSTGTTFGGKNQKGVPSETLNDYKADVSTLEGRLTAARAGYLDNLNGHTAQTGDNYAELTSGTYGLSVIKAYVDELETRLTAARAGYLDELGAANIPADIDTLLSRLTAARASNLDELSAENIPTDIDTLLSRLSSARAGYLDELAAANLPADIDQIKGDTKISIYQGGVWFDEGAANTNTVLGTDGTPDNPVSSDDACRTIGLALGIHRIYVTKASSLVLGADFSNWEIIGVGSHTIDEGGAAGAWDNSATVTGALFRNVYMDSSTDKGSIMAEDCSLNVANPNGTYKRCQIHEIAGVNDGGKVHFDSCYSSRQNPSLEALLDFSSPAAASYVQMSNFHGVLRVRNMNANSYLNLSGAGEVIFEATCSAGTAVVSGNFKVTDSGAIVPDEEGNVNKTNVNAEVDNALDTAIPGSPTADSINERLKTLDDNYTTTRAGYLDELAAANIPADIDTLLSRLTSARAGYLDELQAANIPADIDTLLSRLTAARAGYLDELNAPNIPADIDTLLSRLSAVRAGYLDELDFDLQTTLTALQTSINGVSNVTRLSASVAGHYLIPDAGDEYYLIEVALKDSDGNMEDPDSDDLGVKITGDDGEITSRLFKTDGGAALDASGVSGVTSKLVKDGTGLYHMWLKLSSGDNEEALNFKFGWEEGSVALYEMRGSARYDAAPGSASLADTDANKKVIVNAMRENIPGATASPEASSVQDDLETEINANETKIDTVISELGDGTYGLAAIETLVDELETRLTAARAGYLDNLNGHTPQTGDSYAEVTSGTYGLSVLEGLVDELESRLTAARAGYLDNLNGHTPQTGDSYAEVTDGTYGLAQIKAYVDELETRLTAVRAGYLDELGPTNIPADVDTLLSRLSAARAGYMDYLNIGGNVASSAEVTAIQNDTKLSVYNGGIWLDSSGLNGTTIGTHGTPDNPVDNWSDAQTLADSTGFGKIYVLNPPAVNANISSVELFGVRESNVEVDFGAGSYYLADCVVRGLNITGTRHSDSNSNTFYDCRIDAITNVNNERFVRCVLHNQFILNGSEAGSIVLHECTFEDGQFLINMNSPSAAQNLVFSNTSIDLLTLNGMNANATAYFNGGYGRLSMDSPSAGSLYLNGAWTYVGNGSITPNELDNVNLPNINAQADTALSDYGALKPTVAGRTLDIATTGEAGIDYNNVNGSHPAVDLNAGQEVQLNSQGKTDVNDEIVDALNTDTYAEPGQGTPGATVSLTTKIGYLYKAWRNKKDHDGTTHQLYNDAGSVVDQKSSDTDNGSVATLGKVVTGP